MTDCRNKKYVKIIRIVYSIILISFVPLMCLAANTVTNNSNGTVYEVSAIDSDWDFGTIRSRGSDLRYILFIPGASNDELVVKEDTDAGPIISQMLSTDGEPRIQYFDQKRCIPYLDYSACTFTAGAKVIFAF